MLSKNEIDRVIDASVSSEWCLLAKRSDIPPLPVWYKIKYSGLSPEFKKIFGVSVPWACFWKGNYTELYLHGKEYGVAIQSATKLFYAKGKFKKHIEKLERCCFAARDAAKVFEKSDWKNWESEKLLAVYSSVVDKYVSSFARGFITWCAQVLHEEAKKILRKHSQNLKKIGLSPEQALGPLIVPEKKTAYQEKEIILQGLSEKYKKEYKSFKSEKYLLKNSPRLYLEIEKFIKKYSWVGFNYVGPSAGFKETIHEIVSFQGKRSKTVEKKEIFKICNFSENERYIFQALATISYTKDLRNVTDDYVHFCFRKFFYEISKGAGMEKEDIHFLWDKELSDLILEKRKIDSKYIQKKKEFCAAFSCHKTLKLQEYYLGKEARQKNKEIFENSDQIFKNKNPNILKGTVASAGFARGKVKIVNFPREAGKVKTGEVLVAPMTNPKFMPAIRKAAAIVTDDGGLTNHAAIVAREFQKPCIVGTKIATKVLRDGDLVEVDANQGEIKIIKKK